MLRCPQPLDASCKSCRATYIVASDPLGRSAGLAHCLTRRLAASCPFLSHCHRSIPKNLVNIASLKQPLCLANIRDLILREPQLIAHIKPLELPDWQVRKQHTLNSIPQPCCLLGCPARRVESERRCAAIVCAWRCQIICWDCDECCCGAGWGWGWGWAAKCARSARRVQPRTWSVCFLRLVGNGGMAD